MIYFQYCVISYLWRYIELSEFNVYAQEENCSPIQRVKLKYRFRTNFIRVSTIFVEKKYLRYLFVISTLYNAWIFEKDWIFDLFHLATCLISSYISHSDMTNTSAFWWNVREVFFHIAFCIEVRTHGKIVIIWFFNKHTNFGWICPMHDDEIITFPNFVC